MILISILLIFYGMGSCGPLDHDVLEPFIFLQFLAILSAPIIGLGAIFSTFIIKDLRQYKFRWIVFLVGAVLIFLEIFVIHHRSTCSIDFNKIIIPEI